MIWYEVFSLTVVKVWTPSVWDKFSYKIKIIFSQMLKSGKIKSDIKLRFRMCLLARQETCYSNPSPVVLQFCPQLWTWWTSASRGRAAGAVTGIGGGGALWGGSAARWAPAAVRDMRRRSWSRLRWITCLPVPEHLRGSHWTQVLQTKLIYVTTDNEHAHLKRTENRALMNSTSYYWHSEQDDR